MDVPEFGIFGDGAGDGVKGAGLGFDGLEDVVEFGGEGGGVEC